MPELSSPQHLTLLPTREQVESKEAATWEAGVAPLTVTETGLGLVELLFMVPSPSSPTPLRPAHFIAPPAPMTQSWFPPQATPMAPEIAPKVTGTAEVPGEMPEGGEPSPNWPDMLLPQQRTVPLESRTQLVLACEAMAVTVTQALAAQNPPVQGCAGGATQAPLTQVLCPTTALPEQPGPLPQLPVGNWHWPSDRPAQVPAQAPLPQVPRLPWGAPLGTGLQVPAEPARSQAMQVPLQG
jgi:hypothetical protein